MILLNDNHMVIYELDCRQVANDVHSLNMILLWMIAKLFLQSTTTFILFLLGNQATLCNDFLFYFFGKIFPGFYYQLFE
jgi:hypothetical protein